MTAPFAIVHEIHLIHVCSAQFSLLSIIQPRGLASSASRIFIWIKDNFALFEYFEICVIDIKV